MSSIRCLELGLEIDRHHLPLAREAVVGGLGIWPLSGAVFPSQGEEELWELHLATWWKRAIEVVAVSSRVEVEPQGSIPVSYW